MLDAEHRKPLAAFLLVSVVAALIIGNGLRTDVITRVLERGAPRGVATALAPDLVLGSALRGEVSRSPREVPQEVPAETTELVRVTLGTLVPRSGAGSSGSTATPASTPSSQAADSSATAASAAAAPGGPRLRSGQAAPSRPRAATGSTPTTSTPATPSTPAPPATPAGGPSTAPVRPVRSAVVEVVQRGRSAVDRAVPGVGRTEKAVKQVLRAVAQERPAHASPGRGRSVHATPLAPGLAQRPAPRAVVPTLVRAATQLSGPGRSVAGTAPRGVRPPRAQAHRPEPAHASTSRPHHGRPADRGGVGHGSTHGHGRGHGH